MTLHLTCIGAFAFTFTLPSWLCFWWSLGHGGHWLIHDTPEVGRRYLHSLGASACHTLGCIGHDGYPPMTVKCSWYPPIRDGHLAVHFIRSLWWRRALWWSCYIVIACVDIIYNIQHDNTRTPSSRALLAFATAHIAHHFPPNKTKWKRRAGNTDRQFQLTGVVCKKPASFSWPARK